MQHPHGKSVNHGATGSRAVGCGQLDSCVASTRDHRIWFVCSGRATRITIVSHCLTTLNESVANIQFHVALHLNVVYACQKVPTVIFAPSAVLLLRSVSLSSRLQGVHLDSRPSNFCRCAPVSNYIFDQKVELFRRGLPSFGKRSLEIDATCGASPSRCSLLHGVLPDFLVPVCLSCVVKAFLIQRRVLDKLLVSDSFTRLLGLQPFHPDIGLLNQPCFVWENCCARCPNGSCVR